MTWFEAEQIDLYVRRLEECLDEWQLEPIQMRIESAELKRTLSKIERASKESGCDPLLRHYISTLTKRIHHCILQLDERLKHK